jgi:hypothetical protein
VPAIPTPGSTTSPVSSPTTGELPVLFGKADESGMQESAFFRVEDGERITMRYGATAVNTAVTFSLKVTDIGPTGSVVVLSVVPPQPGSGAVPLSMSAGDHKIRVEVTNCSFTVRLEKTN